jgi:hypothetical protein
VSPCHHPALPGADVEEEAVTGQCPQRWILRESSPQVVSFTWGDLRKGVGRGRRCRGGRDVDKGVRGAGGDPEGHRGT